MCLSQGIRFWLCCQAADWQAANKIGSPFQVKFSGPYTVKSRMSDRDYLVHTPGRRKKVQWCHVNLLKPYHSAHSTSNVKGDLLTADNLALESVRAVATVGGLPSEDFEVPSEPILTGRLNNSEYLSHLKSVGLSVRHSACRSGEVAQFSLVSLLRYAITHQPHCA